MKPTEYKSRSMDGRQLHPETLMMGFGYSPALSEGALKPPIFLTSTFVFATAQQGKDFFDLTAGRRQPQRGREAGAGLFALQQPQFRDPRGSAGGLGRGRALGRVRQRHGGDRHRPCWRSCGRATRILHSRPLYGGTETLIRNQLTAFGITPVGFTDGCDAAQIDAAAERGHGQGPRRPDHAGDPGQPDQRSGRPRRRSPPPPTGSSAAQGHRPPIAVDNTLLGPMYQQPLQHGADLVALLADQICRRPQRPRRRRRSAARTSCCARIVQLRGALGTQLDPHSCWMLLRSLETLGIRAERANENARLVAEYLRGHPRIAAVHYLGVLGRGRPAPGRVRPPMHRARLDLLLRHRGRRGRGLRLPRPAADHEARGQPRRHRDPDLATPPRPPIPACRATCARRSASPTR